MDVIEANGRLYTLSRHALLRANKRKVTLEEIKEALEVPKNIRRTSKEGHEDTITYFGRNGISVVTNTAKTTIITLLRRSTEYAKAKNKKLKNSRRLRNKRLYGNRAKH